MDLGDSWLSPLPSETLRHLTGLRLGALPLGSTCCPGNSPGCVSPRRQALCLQLLALAWPGSSLSDHGDFQSSAPGQW